VHCFDVLTTVGRVDETIDGTPEGQVELQRFGGGFDLGFDSLFFG